MNQTINGVKEGYWEGYYDNDKLDGSWEEYYDNGKLCCRGNCINGKYDGYFENRDYLGRIEIQKIYL